MNIYKVEEIEIEDNQTEIIEPFNELQNLFDVCIHQMLNNYYSFRKLSIINHEPKMIYK